MKLIDLAQVLRSKNAGPLYVTFDIMFDSREKLDAVLTSGALTPEAIGKLYDTSPADVRIIPYPIVNSCKITIPRRNVSGSLDDDDIYGCQQHAPLAALGFPAKEETL